MVSFHNAIDMEQKENKLPHGMYSIVSFICGIAIGSIMIEPYYENPVSMMIFIAIISSFGSFFLEFTFRPGAIFGWYMDFMDKYFRDNRKNPFRFLYQPMGGCTFCMNTWISIITFIIFDNQIGITYWLLLPTIFISHMILSVLDKIFWK